MASETSSVLSEGIFEFESEAVEAHDDQTLTSVDTNNVIVQDEEMSTGTNKSDGLDPALKAKHEFEFKEYKPYNGKPQITLQLPGILELQQDPGYESTKDSERGSDKETLSSKAPEGDKVALVPSQALTVSTMPIKLEQMEITNMA